MSLNILEEHVDIYKKPLRHTNNTDVIIGDLHGNAIKLIFTLIKHKIITGINDKQYNQLVKIYSKNTSKLTANDLKLFDAILDKAHFNKQSSIQLLGDDLSDRGKNDYFTLKTFEKLQLHEVPFEVMLSNHTLEFIEAYEKKSSFSCANAQSTTTHNVNGKLTKFN